MALCRNSFLILMILREKDAINKVYGMTINEIQAIENTSKLNTIHKQIKELESEKLVAEGYKCGRAKTYFVTEQGLEQIPYKNKSKIILEDDTLNE